jgi:hypothetical protein
VNYLHVMSGQAPALRLAMVAASIVMLSSCGGGGNDSGQLASSTAAISASTGSNVSAPPLAANGWTRCAAEGEVCTVPGVSQVRFGIAGKYHYQVVTGSITCSNGAFTDPAIGEFKTCDHAPLNGAAPDGFVFSRKVSNRVLSVGPGRAYAQPCEALKAAGDGDLVEIDAAGQYDGDVCAFSANDLTIRGVNGRPKIDAAGKYVWGKGIWVVLGSRVLIDNVELSGARVPDRNGAAIRLDGMHLTLTNSFIHDNENGILTSNDGASDILIEHCEFGHNGNGSGSSHNLYIGHVASLTFRYNYTHDADVGHNLKSRANVSTISYNRFSSAPPGAAGSTASGEPSYEIDLPNAGTAFLIGNVIEQPAANQNSNLVSYGVEGASNKGKHLYAVNNTFINDDSSSGMFILVGGGVDVPILAQNNVFAGTGNITNQANAIVKDNYTSLAPAFVDRAGYDLRPAAGAPFIGAGRAPGLSPSGVPLAPLYEYAHVAGGQSRTDGARDIGAYSVR